jgi:hypothetical protein
MEPHATLVDRYFEFIEHVHVNELDGKHCGAGDYDFQAGARRCWSGVTIRAGFRSKPSISLPAPNASPTRACAYLESQISLYRPPRNHEPLRRYRRGGLHRFRHCSQAAGRGAARVVVLDNLLTGSEANLAEVRSRIEFERADIRNYEEIAPLIRGAKVVFHEAAIPSVPRSIDDPVPSHDVNANGTFNVLRAAREGEAGRVVYAASSSAYGDTEELPKVESMKPRPKSPYALQKLMANTTPMCFPASGAWKPSACAISMYMAAPGSGQRLLRGAVAFHDRNSRPQDADYLRRWRALARLYVRRRRR